MMCFTTDDCDWYASVVEDDTAPAEKPTKCDECKRLIPVGEPVRHVYMQQHEYCLNDPDHTDYEGDRPDGSGCPEGCEHEYGETSDYDCCQVCNQLIEAIHAHEIASGCGEDESRPNLGELLEAMDGGDGQAYLKKAEELYPGITARLPASFLRFREDEADD